MASTASFMPPRQLYDMQYVEAGCLGEPPAGTTLDDLFGTYASNYLIGAAGLTGAVALLLSPKAAPTYKNLGANFFLWSGLGYGLAGVLHQTMHDEEENQKHKVWYQASYTLTLVGVAAVGLLANRLLAAKHPRISKCEVCLHAAVLLITVAVVILQVVLEEKDSMLATGVWLGLVTLYALIAWALWRSWMKVLGAALMIIGMVVQVVLSPVCGDAGYGNCWEDCPLPAPAFNHNALFHVLAATGLLVLAPFMALVPELLSSSTEGARCCLVFKGAVADP